MSDAPPKTGIDLTLVQVLAGTGAALTAALLGSLFGIAGTLTGTAVGSAVATICTALYTHQLHRTRERLQRRDRSPIEWLRPPSRRALPWLRVAAAAVAIFGVALTALTVVESLTGAPLSSATGRSPDRDRGGTSLGRALVPDRQRERPMPRDIGSATPDVGLLIAAAVSAVNRAIESTGQPGGGPATRPATGSCGSRNVPVPSRRKAFHRGGRPSRRLGRVSSIFQRCCSSIYTWREPA